MCKGPPRRAVGTPPCGTSPRPQKAGVLTVPPPEAGGCREEELMA